MGAQAVLFLANTNSELDNCRRIASLLPDAPVPIVTLLGNRELKTDPKEVFFIFFIFLSILLLY